MEYIITFPISVLHRRYPTGMICQKYLWVMLTKSLQTNLGNPKMYVLGLRVRRESNLLGFPLALARHLSARGLGVRPCLI